MPRVQSSTKITAAITSTSVGLHTSNRRGATATTTATAASQPYPKTKSQPKSSPSYGQPSSSSSALDHVSKLLVKKRRPAFGEPGYNPRADHIHPNSEEGRVLMDYYLNVTPTPTSEECLNLTKKIGRSVLQVEKIRTWFANRKQLEGRKKIKTKNHHGHHNSEEQPMVVDTEVDAPTESSTCSPVSSPVFTSFSDSSSASSVPNSSQKSGVRTMLEIFDEAEVEAILVLGSRFSSPDTVAVSGSGVTVDEVGIMVSSLREWGHDIETSA